MSWNPFPFRMAGGVNVEDPQIVLAPGNVLYAKNYEALQGGGYRRIDGYERFSGQDRPSDAVYWKVPFENGQLEPVVGAELMDAITGVTGYVLGHSLTSGDFGAVTAIGLIYITDYSGQPPGSSPNFTDGNLLIMDGAPLGTCTGNVQYSSRVDDDYETTQRAANEYYRDLITPVPDIVNGTATPAGGFVLDDECFCFFDQVYTDATPSTCKLYKATAAGWVNVPYNSYLPYDTGIGEIFEGDTITGLTSAATAVVKFVNIAAGNYAGPTYASGRIAIGAVTGGPFQNGEDIQVTGVTKATLSNTIQTQTVPVAGRFETIVTNFYGAEDLTRAYGVNGLTNAFVCDGENFLLFQTGMTSDLPTHIEAHRNHLFLSFVGGSLQNSGTGQPLTWSVRTGAAEIGIGDNITGIKSNGSNTLAVGGEKTIQLLYGTSDLDWNLKPLADSFGALAYTMQEVGGQTLLMDANAVSFLLPTNQFGDYSPTPVSRPIRKRIEELFSTVTDSIEARKKSQYRLFFSGGEVWTATFVGSKLTGWMPQIYPDPIIASWQGTINGVTRMFAATSTLLVLELDRGTSYDGVSIESVLTLPFTGTRNPDRNKRFHKASFEMDTLAPIDIRVKFDFDYGTSDGSDTQDKTTGAVGGVWDVSSWDQFSWSSATVAYPECNINGVGFNVSTTIWHESDVDDPFTIQAETLLWTPRAQKR